MVAIWHEAQLAPFTNMADETTIMKDLMPSLGESATPTHKKLNVQLCSNNDIFIEENLNLKYGQRLC